MYQMDKINVPHPEENPDQEKPDENPKPIEEPGSPSLPENPEPKEEPVPPLPPENPQPADTKNKISKRSLRGR